MRLPKWILTLYISILVISVSHSQIDVDTTYKSLYNSLYLYDTPYEFRADPEIKERISFFANRLGISTSFEQKSSSINGIGVIQDSSRYLLLYNRVEVKKLIRNNPLLADVMILHSLAHIARGHQCDDVFRIREESAVFKYIGQAAYQLGIAKTVEELQQAIENDEYAYSFILPLPLRYELLQKGWASIDAIIKSNDNLGYLDNKNVQENLPLPVFNKTGCPQRYKLPLLYFNNCKTLADIDSLLSPALKKLGYTQLSYYYVPGGYVILTPVEQINQNGKALQGKERWQDYPAGGRFEGIMDYLSSLVLPRPGYFRLFAFVVTNQFIEKNDGKVDGKIARSWLENGGDWLPREIAEIKIDGHHITSLLYEFEVPESTQKMSERCTNQLFKAEQHLKHAGILNSFLP